MLRICGRFLNWLTITESSLLVIRKGSELTDLLKKDAQWVWVVRCNLPFEVHTDTSDKVIGGVLVQEGHHVAFES